MPARRPREEDLERELRGRPRGLRQAGGGDRRPGELHGRRRRGHGIVRGRADEEARGARVQRRRGAQAQEGQGEARRGEERPAGRRARGAQGGVREGLLRAEVAGRLGRGGAPALRRAQAGRRDVHVLRGLREVDAHDGPGRLWERFRGRERPKDLMPLLARGRKAGDALEESVLASLRSVAAVWKEARSQVESLDERIRALLEANAPALLGVEGCGTTTAAALVVAAGDNPGRLRGEAAFSMMCGASPIPASSGKTDRHRLNRGGNRQANWALYEIAIKRMAYDERTRRYVARRTSEGKSRREAVRCLKRYIAREVYRVLMDPNPDGAAPEGPELAKMRKAMRVTQKKAAAELGLSAATLGHLERGKRRSTKLERRYYELLCELERALPQTAS